MSSFPTLLVAVDPSGDADAVCTHAIALARALGSRVVLLHVGEALPGVHADSPRADAREVAQQLADEIDADMAPLISRFLEAGVDVRADVRRGDAASTILAAADDVDASLIVVGTAGREGLARLVVGSVAGAVIRRSRVPVVSVREAMAKPG